MKIIETVITEGHIKLTLSDQTPLDPEGSWIVIRLPRRDADRSEAVLAAQAEGLRAALAAINAGIEAI
jgi:hypothetical protein